MRLSARILTGLTFAALAVSSASAQEKRWPRWYLGLSGSLNFLQDSDSKGNSTGELSYDQGGGGAIALGYSPPLGGALNNLRLEAELGYRFADLDGYTLNGVPGSSQGQTAAWSYMGNVYYDFRNGSQWTPYLGAGAGYSTVKLARKSGLGNTGNDDTAFAYQFMAGLAYAPESIPLTEWNVGYRYFNAHGPEFAASSSRVELDDYASHGLELGAKFRF